MKIKSASYLYKNRHGVFYFRAVIPKRFLCYFANKREIKRSLKTENKHIALKLARKYMVDFDKILADIQSGKVRTSQLITAKDLKLNNGVTIGEISIDHGNSKSEYDALMALVGSSNSTTEDIPDLSPPSYTLSEIAEKYCDIQLENGDWKEQTFKANTAIYKVLFRIIDKDTPISSITRIHLTDMKSKIRKLPTNMNKHARYKEKTIDQILAMKDITPLSKTTLDKYITRISGLFNWAEIEGYMDRSIAKRLSDGPDTEATRLPFSLEDIRVIFHKDNFNEFPVASNYWVPIIGLYSGARLNEICQLFLQDIQIVDGIYIFILREGDPTQSIKNNPSKRSFPIHPQILKLGFIEYIEFLKSNNQQRLFPELTFATDSGYARATSDFFTLYLKKRNIHIHNVKVFHSFRHTFINHLKQKKVRRDFVSGIVGHSLNSITFEGYAEAYEPSVLKPCIDIVDYGLEHTPFVIDAKKIKKSWK